MLSFSSFVYACLCFTFANVCHAVGFKPIRRYTGASQAHDILKRHDIVAPKAQVDLHYVPESGSSSMAVTVTATHRSSRYVVLEDLEPGLSNVSCAHDSAQTTIDLVFGTVELLQFTQNVWLKEASLLFVTQHEGCNADDERAVYKASSFAFDDKSRKATIIARPVMLGDSSEASSQVRIRGGHAGAYRPSDLRKRATDPITSDFSFDTAWDPEETILHLDGILDLTCVNCSASGSAAAYFDYTLSTDIIDCIDAMKDAGDDIGAKILAGIRCFGDALVALGRGLLDEVAALLNGQFTLPIVGWILPKADLGIQATSDITADFNFKVGLELAKDLQCSFPGDFTACLGGTLGKKLAGINEVLGKGSAGFEFKVGSWTLALSSTWGLTLDVKTSREIDITFPVTAAIGNGQGAFIDVIHFRAQNSLNPQIDFKTPILDIQDSETCATIALGASVSASLSSSNFKKAPPLSMSARLDLPRVGPFCFQPVQNVDSQCNSPGDVVTGVELQGTIDVGLDVKLSSFLGETDNLTPELYREITFPPFCFGVEIPQKRSVSNSSILQSAAGGMPSAALPDNLSTTSSAAAAAATTTVTSYTSVEDFDCSDVEPTPGNRPCPLGGYLTCRGLYRWSCPTGEYGIVPPGTFCACGEFRQAGWAPPNADSLTCFNGIACVDEQHFALCSSTGIEESQLVAPGTACRGGRLVWY